MRLFRHICTRFYNARRLLLLLLVVMLSTASPLEAQRLGVDDFRRKLSESQQLFQLEMEQFGESLQEVGRTLESKEVFQDLAEMQDSQQMHVALPKEIRTEIPPVATPATVWRHDWRRRKDRHASEMFTLSQDVMRQQHIGLGYRTIRYVLRVNPDHAEARRMLGYVRDGDQWLTPFELQMKKDGEIWSNLYGWILKTDLQKYENGQRPFRGRWISEQQDRNLRLAEKEFWEVRTEHWVIRTDHSLEKGVEIASKLEDFFQFFIREFPDLFNSRGQMKELLNIGYNGRARINKNPMRVNYFRSRESYVERLKDIGPIIGSTNGIYLHNLSTSFFYSRPEKPEEEESTIYHEATHQILFESRPNPRLVAQEKHFWVVEGFACYMESYRNNEGVISLGDPQFIRFNNAIVRVVLDRYYIGLEGLSSLGQAEFQQQAQLPKLYSQASGLAHFFIHAHDGKYRDDFGIFLAGIYASRLKNGRDVPPLDRLTKKMYRDLDDEYVRYMAQLAEEIATDVKAPR